MPASASKMIQSPIDKGNLFIRRYPVSLIDGAAIRDPQTGNKRQGRN
jgi:hypothetical protein